MFQIYARIRDRRTSYQFSGYSCRLLGIGLAIAIGIEPRQPLTIPGADSDCDPDTDSDIRDTSSAVSRPAILRRDDPGDHEDAADPLAGPESLVQQQVGE